MRHTVVWYRDEQLKKTLSNQLLWERMGTSVTFTKQAPVPFGEWDLILVEDTVQPALAELSAAGGLEANLIFLVRREQLESLAKVIKEAGAACILLPLSEVSTLEETMLRMFQGREDKSRLVKLWEDNQKIVQERFWFDILYGKYYGYCYAELCRYADLRGVHISRELRYVPVLIHICRKDLNTSTPKSWKGGMHRNTRLFAMNNLILDILLHGVTEIPIVTLADNLFGVVRVVGREGADSDLEKDCLQFRSCYQQYFDYTALCVPGQAVKIEQLSEQCIFLTRRLKDMTAWIAAEGEDGDIIAKIKNYVQNHLQEPITREELAQKLGMNADYMAKLFKQKTGELLSNYITRQKLFRAKDLLLNSTLSVSQIAVTVGFHNFSYFSKCFRDETGISPRQYRSQISRQAGP